MTDYASKAWLRRPRLTRVQFWTIAATVWIALFALGSLIDR